MENPVKRILKRMWYKQLLKSQELPKDIAQKFFIEDRIDPMKFRENYAYYFMDRYGKHEPTPSCFSPGDLPLAFPRWFGSAYPDVVKYFSTLEETEFVNSLRAVGISGEDFRDYANPKVWEIGERELHHLSVEVLYRLKERYKQLHLNTKLECQ